MTKRLLHLFLVLSLVLTLIPMHPGNVEAAWGDNNKNQKNFIFPDLVAKVNYKYLTLHGSLNQVSPNGITYSVKNVSSNIETAPTSRGITVSDDGKSITVANIELYDGDNLITFYGKQGSSDVVNTYEVTYISTPLLYNLQFTGGGKKMSISPTDVTYVTQDFSSGDSYFTVEGNAPNVTQVIIKNGKESVSATVSQDSEAYFIVGRLKLKKGKNELVFLLKNNNQTVEVKREVVYFDGSGTFYDVNLKYDTNLNDLSTQPTIKVSEPDGASRKPLASFEGFVIIPKETRLTSFDYDNPTNLVKVSHKPSTGTAENVPDTDLTYTKVEDRGSYVIYKFTYSANSFSNSLFENGQLVYTQYQAFNPVATYKTDPTNTSPVPTYDDSTGYDFAYKFLDANAPYVKSLEYRFASGSSFNPLLDNTIINEKPFIIRMYVPNGTSTSDIKVTSENPYGVTSNVTINNITEGSSGSGKYYDLTINSLPFDGTQTLTVYYDPHAFMKVSINAAAGPVLTFDGLYDNLIFKYDPNQSDGPDGYAIKENGSTKYLITTILKEFKGRLDNVVIDPINDYKPDASGKKVITLLVNNSEVNLEQDTSRGTNYFKMSNNQGTLDPGKTVYGKVSQYFHDGQNSIVFKYVKNNLVYEKRLNVTLYSNSLPVIPVPDTEGVYPYNTTERKPDNRFVGSNGVYTTKETEMKITGTFDFIDLGDDANEVNATISGLPKNKYLFVIEGPSGFTPKTWDLAENTLLNIKNNKPFDSGQTDVPGLDVYYDTDKQYFTFVLDKQDIPTDGTKVAYTFIVYNNGVNGGSKASYRIEVSAPGMAYKILRPTNLQSTINQNYVEVVIEAKNADKVVVGKQTATKVGFDNDMDGNIDTQDAFRAIVSDLKANKVTKIPITITRGSDTVSDSIEVFYAPTAIPGAQFMTPMGKSHKVFDGKVTLAFEKDTYLIRQDYNVPQNLRGQVFKGHQILFAIANSEDGVVDRYDYLPDRPKNFDDTIEDLGRQFKNSFDSHFVKVSNVYWIDAGMADDPSSSSPEYDPYPYGMLPIMPNPESMQPKLYNFNAVPSNRVLIPSKRGTLELAYDKNVVPGSANHLTVMRYDPKRFYWENLGGVVNTSKGTIKVPFDKFGYYVVAKLNDSFQDVVDHPYARNHMEAMFAKGVVLPKSALEFGPDAFTTRGEFAAMVVRALQLPLVENVSKPSFDDVVMDYTATSLYDYRHIETAARLGIVRGTAPRIFEPQGKITREEAAVILARALKLKTGTSSSATNMQLAKYFKDYNLIEDYASPYVLAITKLKLIVGEPIDPTDPKRGYVFNPKAQILRSDSAILMARVMANQKLIPAVYEVK